MWWWRWGYLPLSDGGKKGGEKCAMVIIIGTLFFRYGDSFGTQVGEMTTLAGTMRSRHFSDSKDLVNVASEAAAVRGDGVVAVSQKNPSRESRVNARINQVNTPNRE
ncbi:hypothetical protein BHE74_00059179 [Ensete ventricosum]|nr:hypothetical protein BHE74_00059179 [Ensete ventricosum]